MTRTINFFFFFWRFGIHFWLCYCELNNKGCFQRVVGTPARWHLNELSETHCPRVMGREDPIATVAYLTINMNLARVNGSAKRLIAVSLVNGRSPQFQSNQYYSYKRLMLIGVTSTLVVLVLVLCWYMSMTRATL